MRALAVSGSEPSNRQSRSGSNRDIEDVPVWDTKNADAVLPARKRWQRFAQLERMRQFCLKNWFSYISYLFDLNNIYVLEVLMQLVDIGVNLTHRSFASAPPRWWSAPEPPV